MFRLGPSNLEGHYFRHRLLRVGQNHKEQVLELFKADFLCISNERAPQAAGNR